MSEDVHERALRLLAAERVEALGANERTWLDEHLEHCADCTAHAQATEEALSALRAISVPVRPALLAATQLRVRLRARELHEQRARMRALWMACTLSWGLGVISAPLLWRGIEWLGERLALPQAVWLVAFPLLWTIPAAVVGAALAWWRARAMTENGYAPRP